MSSNSEDYDALSFLGELESRFGGKITFRTFASFYADNSGIVRDHGVFLYVIDGVFRFQDFKPENSILGIPVKRKSEYVKFESSFSAQDVRTLRIVRRKAAEDFCMGYKAFEKIKEASLLTRILCETVLEIGLENGSFLYFRFMDRTVEKMITQANSLANRV